MGICADLLEAKRVTVNGDEYTMSQMGPMYLVWRHAVVVIVVDILAQLVEVADLVEDFNLC